jgi:hypothetical protein
VKYRKLAGLKKITQHLINILFIGGNCVNVYLLLYKVVIRPNGIGYNIIIILVLMFNI